MAATALAVGWAALYAIRHSRVEDTAPICDAIREAGPVAPDFCDGAIEWLERSDGAFEQVVPIIQATGWHLGLWALGVALALVPLARLMQMCQAPRRTVLMLAAMAMPFLLLFPVGFDWGRWVMIQVSIVCFVMLGLMARGQLVPRGRIKPVEPAIWLVLAMVTGLNLAPFLMPLSFMSNALRALAGV